jgi:spore coat protein CotH
MKNTKLVKIGVIMLIAIFLVTALVYKIYGAINTNVSNAATNKAADTTQTSNTAEYDSIFKKDSVIDIKVEIADADLKSILADPLAEEYKSATVTVDGKTIKNVGFRTKGNLTLRSVANTDSDRYSFRIKLDKYVEGQNLLGLDELVVNNMYSDASYMREYLSYEALREAGADVPETVFANVYINGELQGFYLCVEAIDDSFLERNFGNNDGSLYKQ